MSKRFLSIWSMIAAVSMMLVILPFGTGIQAAPSGPGSTAAQSSASSTKDNTSSVKRDPRLQDATADETEGDPSTPAMYIVRLQGEPLASYMGGVENLAPTSPVVTGAPKLLVNSSASQSYRSYLTQQRQQVTNRMSALLGSQLKIAYTYDVAFNGMALMLTPAQAAKVSKLPGVVSVHRSITQQLDTDAGPMWIKANQIWDGSATGLYVTTILGANEVPPTASSAWGKGTFTLSGSTLSYNIQVTGITPNAAHIHRASAGVSGPIVVALTPGPSAGTYVGSTTLSGSDLTLLQSEGLYVNFHSATYPGGEIRGQINGDKGEGVLVGVIDTGINFGHPSFAAQGGDGYTHINPFGAGNYIGVCNPSDPMYQPTKVCNAKLVGGRTYPDTIASGNSPEDDDGHGSHTASTVAGNVITSTLLNGVSLGQISGVAPHANIISYDTCNTGAGCPNAALIAAINDAITDGVDVINYSIGGGSRDPWTDDSALAFLNARNAGIFVAVSAGNSGPGASTIGSPANAPWVTAAGASTHNRVFQNTVTNLTSSAGSLSDIVGKSLTNGYSAHPIVYAGAAPYNNPLCNPFPAGTFTGEIVICDRGTVGRVAKGQNVLAAGGGGMVLANDAANGNSLIADAHVLPAVHISYSDGVALKAWLATGSNHMAAISGTTKNLSSSNGDIVASFSSRGPDATSPNVLKPDVSAPGVDILAAGLNDSNTPEPEYEILSGTSMASPHTAGAGVLIRVVHPDWTPAEIQSALMTTAIQAGVLKEDGSTDADPFDRGGGRIDVGKAVQAALVLDETRANYLAADPAVGGDARTLNIASLSDMNCVSTCTWTRTLSSTVGVPTTWDATASSVSNIAVSITPSSFTIAAHGEQTISITADVTGLPKDVPLFANVTLTENTSTYPTATLPMAVTSVDSVVPDSVEITTRRNSGTQESGDITANAVSDLTVRKYGFVKATMDTTSLPGDPTNGAVYDDLTIAGGIYIKTVTVPAGTKRLVAEITESAATDSDLIIHRDGAGGGAMDGIPSAAEQVCASTSGSALEYCDVEDPPAGTYLIMLHNFDASNNPPDAMTLATALVPATDAGNMTVSGPMTVPAGTPFTVMVGWNIPSAQAGDRWYGAFDLGTDAGNPGNIGTIPVNLNRLPDEVGVTKTVSPGTANPGDTVTYTLTVKNQDTISHTIALTDVLPAGVTYVPGSVTGGATYNAGQNSITISSLLNLVPADNYDYEDSLTVPDLGDSSPLGGFVDFSAPPYNFTPGAKADNTAFNFDTTCPVAFYDSAAGSPTFIGYSTNGLLFPRGAPNLPSTTSAITTSLPSAPLPNGLIAGFWGNLSLGNNNGLTNVGRMLVNFGAVPCSEQVSILQLKRLHTKTDSSPTRNVMDVEYVYEHSRPNDYWVLYGNVHGPLTSGVIGLENQAGTLGLQYLYGNTPSAHIPTDGLVIHYFRPLVASPPITITFQATVDNNAPAQVTNVANYSVAGDSMMHSVNASFTNPTAVPTSIVASAGATQSAQVNTAFATALQATVTNSNSDPIAGVTVTFTAPGSGASGSFTGSGLTATAVTNASGVATAPTFTANGTAGSYVVSASVSGLGTTASFNLTNTPPPPTPPSITTQPVNQTIVSGQTATLSVVASGTAPLAYQWYQGSSGNTSSPIGGATSSSYTTPSLTSTQSYWVRVSNGAGHVDSNTATVTVTPLPTPPSITTQPLNKTISSGQTTTLSVVATGTGPLTYQWYQGSSGNTSSPIGGATSSSYTTPVLTSTHSYWVRVSNSAGHADSNTATVTVTPNITKTFFPALMK